MSKKADFIKPVKAALYIRVACEPQPEEHFGLEIQKRILTDYCARNGYQVAEIFSDMASGFDDKRDGLKEMISRLNDFNVIVVKDFSRLFRDTFKLYELAGQAENHNVSIKSINDGDFISRNFFITCEVLNAYRNRSNLVYQ